jgi:hypothetical protein
MFVSLLQCARIHWPKVASSARMAAITARQTISTSLVPSAPSVMTMWREKWCQHLAILTTKSALHAPDAGGKPVHLCNLGTAKGIECNGGSLV